MSNTLKPLSNAQTVRGRPTPNDDDELAFRTMTKNHISTLTNLIRNFNAGESKLIFDNEHNGTKAEQ